MAKYRVVYTVSRCNEETIEANSFEDAQKKWEDEGLDGELFFIEDENGDQIIFD